MVRTKNSEPTSTYSDSSRESSLRIPNFVLLGPPQPICHAKPLKSRPAKMKHTPNDPRRSSRLKFQVAARNTTGKDPNEPIDLEADENVPAQGTEQVKIPEEPVESSKASPKKVVVVKKERTKREKSVSSLKASEKSATVDSSKSEKGGVLKKRKNPDMTYWNKKSIASGTDYVIEDIEKLGWNITPFLSFQGWEHFINLDCLVYRERVREFYANAVYTLEPLVITSEVSGKIFSISPYSLGKSLNLSSEGMEIFEEGWYNALGISGQELRRILLKDPSLPISTPNLKPIVKLLHHICVHNLLPRQGTFDKVSYGDQIVLYHLLEKKALNLPFMMMHHMINAIKADKLQNSLPYGKALTIIFNSYLLQFPENEGVPEPKPFLAKNLKLMKLGAAPSEEQDEGKTKKQKTSHEKNDEALEDIRREARTKKKNDSSKTEKDEELKKKEKGKEILTEFAPEKVPSPKGHAFLDAEKSATSTSDDERTISDRRSQSNSVHSTSKGSKAPMTKVYTRDRNRRIFKIPELEVTSTLVDQFNQVVTPEKDQTSEKDGQEGTEVFEYNSSGEKTIELVEGTQLNLEEEIEPTEVIAEEEEEVEKEEVEKEVVEKEEAEKKESEKEQGVEQEGSEKGALEEQNDDSESEQGAQVGMALNQTNPSSPQGEFIRNPSSPLIQTPIPSMFPEQMPTLPPFSPSLHLPNTQPIHFSSQNAPPTEPSPIATISRVTSHNMESLLAAIDINTNISPLKTNNTITSSNLNQFLNLNQTPQTDSPQPIYPPFPSQTMPADMPTHFGSLESTFAALGEPSGTANVPEKGAEAPEKGAETAQAPSNSPNSSALLEKRMSKMEKMMKRMKELLKGVLQGQAIIQQAQRAQAARDESYRNWVVQQGFQANLQPDFGPFEQFPDVPRPATSSSSDGSSPSK